MEFSQYRAYEPGDDLRLLDWKMVARSGKYFIKQSEVDTNTTIRFIVDASASMQHTEGGLAKLQFTKVLLASLGFLAQNQGDAIGLFALNDADVYNLYPHTGVQQFNHFLQRLLLIEAKGKWPGNKTKIEKLYNRKSKELVVFITDLYQEQAELSTFINSLKTTRNEVVVLHLLGSEEFRFSYTGTVIFEDLETGKQVKVAAAKARGTYLAALADKLENHRQQFFMNNISYEQFLIGDPLEKALAMFLKKRLKLV